MPNLLVKFYHRYVRTGKKHSLYGFETIRSFGHPFGDLGKTSPADKGGLLFYIFLILFSYALYSFFISYALFKQLVIFKTYHWEVKVLYKILKLCIFERTYQ